MQAKELFHNVSDRVTGTGSPASTRQRTQMYAVNSVPKPNESSKYSPAWESYVAANLHFYLVPLAIFLRRARELDFAGNDFQKSMGHLQRVTRVFSPQLVNTIDALLDNQKATEKLREVVEQHEENLGEFCPIRSKDGENAKMWNLDMLQEGMHNLLEEIVVQHRKTVGEQDFFERLGARFERFFARFEGEGSRAEELAIPKLIQRAAVIVKFPKDYEVVPSTKRKDGLLRGLSNLTGNGDISASESNFSPEREHTGFITEKGREQILHGTRMCNAMDINFLGDPMFARPKSHEIKFLVKWALHLSNKLNVYFGLYVPRQCSLYGEESMSTAEQLAKEGEQVNKIGLFRFNLRFVANTSNWLVMFVMWKLLRWKVTG